MAEQFLGRAAAAKIAQVIREGINRQFGRVVQAFDARLKHVEQQISDTPSMDVLRGEIDAAVAKIELPKGEKGEDGKSVTLDDVRPLIELAAREAALQVHRDAQAQIQRAIDNMPKPKDGASIEDFDIAIKGRRLMVGMQIGGKPVMREVRLDIPIFHGLYQPGQKSEKDDIVTFGGSAWIALQDTEDAPGSSDSWRLLAKRGRDGKNAKPEEQ